MISNRSIDIVIPSFRVNESTFLNIIHLEKPKDFIITIFLVIDNPLLQVPPSIKKLSENGMIHLILNKSNLGVAATRNNGIRAGRAKWVLLLDDDITPNSNLLKVYAESAVKNPDAIGFVGVTYFQPPFNNATKAMEVNGSIAQFKIADIKHELMWAPTANIMISRSKADPNLFNEDLKKSCEDTEFLARTALLNDKKYIAAPNAIVNHPWWSNGKLQLNRIYRYGAGAAQIARLPHIKPYTYFDFLNTIEMIFLLVVLSPLIICFSSWKILLLVLAATVMSELLTISIKTFCISKSASPVLIWYSLLMKNSYELGRFIEDFKTGNVRGFARRIEMGFEKPHPSWFRLNKWKIIKMIILALLIILLRFCT